MIRNLIIIFLLTPILSVAQELSRELRFNTNFYDAVDKWVVFPKKDIDTTYALGFIYLDNQAGFTLDYTAQLQFKGENMRLIPRDSTVGSMKYRLGANTSLVYIPSPGQIASLSLPDQPEWLYIYKQDSETVSYLTREGYHYNHVGACKLALKPLLKAYKMDPHHDGLEFELAYAYNHLGQYEDAIDILDKAIANDPDNFYFYRELGFSYARLDKAEKAEAIYRKGIDLSDDQFEKSEMAVNMAQVFFKRRDKEKFDEWAKLTRLYAEDGSRYLQYIDSFETNWDQEK